MRAISLGKYDSVLSHRGERQHSSTMGGLLTVAFIVLMLAFDVATAIDTFSPGLKHLNLDTTARPLVMYNTDKNLKIIDEIRACPEDSVC